MEIYTVIQYVFGQTKLIYSGINKELAYQVLQSNENNYLHVWENDVEIRREGRGIDNNEYKDYLLHNSSVHTLVNRIECSSSQVGCCDWVNEENQLWMECEADDGEITFEISLERISNNEVTLTFGCTNEEDKTLEPIFAEIKEILMGLLSDKYVLNGIKTAKKPLSNNPY